MRVAEPCGGKTRNEHRRCPDEALDGAVELEECVCANCGTAGGSVLLVGSDRLHNLPGSFAVVRCDRCGLMRTNPRPTRRSIRQVLSRRLRTLPRNGTRELEPHSLVPSPDRRSARHRDSRRPERATFGNRRCVWQLHGADATARVGRHGNRGRRNVCPASRRSDSAPASCATILDATALENDQFDLICAWMVFEHLHDPIEAFERCFDWLKPGGWLAFSVPDGGSWQFRTFQTNWFALQVPTHLYHFHGSALTGILRRLGYEQITIQVAADFDRRRDQPRARRGERLRDHRRLRARQIANSLPRGPSREASASWQHRCHLTGRLTVWAQKPTS